MIAFSESIVEDAALAWLEALDYSVFYGFEITSSMLLPRADTRICMDVT
jgi:hypothetical protein